MAQRFFYCEAVLTYFTLMGKLEVGMAFMNLMSNGEVIMELNYLENENYEKALCTWC